MKASAKMILNGYVASGCIKRCGKALVIDPWAFPSEDEYESLLELMREDYVFSATEAGVVAVPHVE
ncbi:MAG: hypothetical protein AAGU74_08205 [Bacillota bacterium]